MNRVVNLFYDKPHLIESYKSFIAADVELQRQRAAVALNGDSQDSDIDHVTNDHSAYALPISTLLFPMLPRNLRRNQPGGIPIQAWNTRLGHDPARRSLHEVHMESSREVRRRPFVSPQICGDMSE